MDASAIMLFELGFILLHAVIALPLNSIVDPYPLLLNSSSDNPIRGIHCFRQQAHLDLPTHDDCVTLIDLILQSPDLFTSKTWSLTSTQTTAAAWSHGTCKIEIGVWQASPQTNPIRQDTFSMFSFVGKAQAINQECVGGRRKTGGISVIGPKNLFQVLIRYAARASLE